MYRNEGDSEWVDRFSVDVKDESGLVRRGLVRDIVPKRGLILDFDYPGHNADLISFGKCLQPESYEDRIWRTNSIDPGDLVDVLLKRSPDEPWYWYAATACHVDPLERPSNGYGLVEVDGQSTKEVVLPTQLRSPKEQTDTVSPKHFQKHTITVPAVHASIGQIATGMSGFMDQWKRSIGEMFVDFSGQKLVYITAADGKVQACDSIKATFSTIVQQLTEKAKGTKRTADHEEAPLPLAQPVDDGMKTLLPEILSEVFTYLDVVDQTKFLRVCHRWQAVLQATPTTARVAIDLNNTTFRIADLVNKSVTQATKGLLLTNSSPEVRDEKEMQYHWLGAVKAVLEWKSIKLPRIVVRGSEIDPDPCPWNIAFKQKCLPCLDEWRAVCDELVLEKVVVVNLMAGTIALAKRWVVKIDRTG